jgi:hypothetical protein
MNRVIHQGRNGPVVVISLLVAGLLPLSSCLVHAETNSARLASGRASPTDFSGKVSETMNTGGYTYFLVDTGKEKTWAAAQQFTVKFGDKVAVADGMPIPNYHSKTLNRDFELVVFTGNVSVNGVSAAPGAGSAAKSGQLPQGHPPISGGSAESGELPKGHPPIAGGDAKPVINLSNIKKAEGGKTIAEIYAQQSELNGKKVKVRGRVVKYNSDILGKNWIHIQDGTGKAGNNDLALTSTATANVGHLILVKGVVALNRDFGGGYKYGVILENAELTAE